MAYVMTVRGPIAPADLGATLMHEHVFVDSRSRWDPSALVDPGVGAQPFSAEYGASSRWDWRAFRDSMCQLPDTDYELIREEVGWFARAGGSCVVEVTNGGLAPAPLALRRLSGDLGLHVVAGCGWYVHDMHPEWIESADVDEMTERLHSDVVDGIGGTGVRPGIIGEIGTSEELAPCEELVLRASARVARRTGRAINVHCHPPRLDVVIAILDILEGEGQDLRRVSLSHLDEISDVDYHRQVLSRGAVIGFDSFGHDGGYFSPTWRSRSDLEKMSALAKLVELGHGDQLVLSQDMHRKHFLHRFGGYGYDHVLSRIVPRLRSVFGLSQEQLMTMLVDTPRRLLTIDAPGAGDTE